MQSGIEQIQPGVHPGEYAFDAVRHRTDHESQRAEPVLQLPHLGDVGGDFHHLGDLAGRIDDRCGPNQNIDLFSNLGVHHHFFLVVLAVLEGLRHRTVAARRRALFVGLVAGGAGRLSEGVPKQAIGGGNVVVPIQHDDVAGNLLEKLMIALLGGPQFGLQPGDLGNVGDDLEHEFNFTAAVANRCRVYHYRIRLAVAVAQHFPAALPTLPGEGLPHGTVGGAVVRAAVDDIARLPHHVAQSVPVELVAALHLQIPAVERHEARHFVEEFHPRVHVPGDIQESRRQAVHGLPQGGEPFEFDDLGGFFGHQCFQVFRIGPDLAAHVDAFVGAFQSDTEGIVVNRLGDEIGGFQLEALDGQVHVAMPCNHDDLGLRILLLDLLQQSDAIHARHLDIRHDNGRPPFPEALQAVLAVGGGSDHITEFSEVNLEKIAQVRFVIHHQYSIIGDHRSPRGFGIVAGRPDRASRGPPGSRQRTQVARRGNHQEDCGQNVGRRRVGKRL